MQGPPTDIMSLRPDELRLIFAQLNPKDVVSLCNASPGLRRFCDRYNIWRQASGEFARLDGDTLALVQQDLQPYQVVAFCNLNPGFRRNCNKPGFWPAMLRRHFPDVQIENNTTEATRQAYLENTTIMFLLQFDPYGDNPGFRNDEGVYFEALEYFGPLHRDTPALEAYLVPTDENWADEGQVALALSGLYFGRDTAWVLATGRYNELTVRPFDTRANAINAAVQEIDFGRLTELTMNAVPDEEAYQTMVVPVGPDYQEMYFNAYLVDVEADQVTLTLSTQAVWDELHSMGYPQFVAGETLTQARERMYDYIDRNGFFMQGANFTAEEIDPSGVVTWQIFQVRLNKTLEPGSLMDQF